MSLTLNLPIGGPGNGLWPADNKFRVRNVSGSSIAAGRVVMLDLNQTDADVTSVVPGHTTNGADDSVFACVLLPDTLNTKKGQLVCLLDTIAAGATGMCAALGYLNPVFVDGSGTTITKGAPLVANTAGALVIAPATTDGTKIVGYLMSTASVTTATTATVWFNGCGAGFGSNGT
jgi:hypothetical protein